MKWTGENMSIESRKKRKLNYLLKSNTIYCCRYCYMKKRYFFRLRMFLTR